jgi:hypothetical protein
MKGGMLRSAVAFFFLALVRVATGRDRIFADDARAVARWDFHSAFAGARYLLAVTKGFGPRPLPAVISSIDRLEATGVSSSKIRSFCPSRANSSRCLIRSQLVRYSPSRLRIRSESIRYEASHPLE